MANQEAGFEAIEVLLHRIEVMDCLRTGPQKKPGLVETLDRSRSTVDRAIRDLETIGLVEYTDGKYTATTLGELATDQVFDLVETLHVGTQLQPFLKWVPADRFDLELQYLADAELYVPEPNDPYAMVNRHVKMLEESLTHRIILPLTGLHAMKAVHETVVEKEGENEAIVTPGVADTFQSNPDYNPLFEELTATGRFDVFVYDGEIPFFLGVFQDVVQIGVDEGGEPRALVESGAEEVRNWAEELFEQYKQQSRRLI